MYMQVCSNEMQWACYYGVLLPASFPAMSGQCPAAWKCSRTIFCIELNWTNVLYEITGLTPYKLVTEQTEASSSKHSGRPKRKRKKPAWFQVQKSSDCACMILYVSVCGMMTYYDVLCGIWYCMVTRLPSWFLLSQYSPICLVPSCCQDPDQQPGDAAGSVFLDLPPKFYKIMCLYPPWPNSSVMFRRCSSYIWYFVDLFWYFWSFLG